MPGQAGQDRWAFGVTTTVPGLGAAALRPVFYSLVVVIICGHSFATMLTSVVVRTLYAIFVQMKNDALESPAIIDS